MTVMMTVNEALCYFRANYAWFEEVLLFCIQTMQMIQSEFLNLAVRYESCCPGTSSYSRKRNKCMHVFYPRVCTMFMLRLFVSIMGVFCPCSGEHDPLHAYSPGDIIIGGLFSVHARTNRSTRPGPLSCSE